jgi:tetratricopeptide (TPR) repeat protein
MKSHVARLNCWLLAAVMLVLSVPAGVLAMQTRWRASVLRSSVTVFAAQRSAQNANAYRVYDTAESLVLTFLFSNDSPAPVVLPLSPFSTAIAVTTRGPEGEQLEVTWQPAFRLNGDDLRSAQQSQRVVLDPDRGLTWRMELRRPNRRRLEEGEYEISVSFTDALATLRDQAGQRWYGTGSQGGTLYVTVAPPANATEAAINLTLHGKEAVQDDQYADAVEWFRKATVADPTYMESFVSLGTACFRLKRYRDAVNAFEPAVSAGYGGVHVPKLLGMSYMGVGDRTNAVRVLRRSGLSASKIPDEIQRMERLLRTP